MTNFRRSNFPESPVADPLRLWQETLNEFRRLKDQLAKLTLADILELPGDAAVFLDGTGVFSAPAGGGGNGVEAVVDFGSDGDLATVTVTGQAWVTADSKIVAQVFGNTADHDDEDALLEQLQVTITNRVVGTGFDVLVHAPEGTHGQYRVHCVGV